MHQLYPLPPRGSINRPLVTNLKGGVRWGDDYILFLLTEMQLGKYGTSNERYWGERQALSGPQGHCHLLLFIGIVWHLLVTDFLVSIHV